MKKILFYCLVVLCAGCAHSWETYVEDPKTLLEDPLTVNHQAALDDLESRYLHKEMTYAEYLDRKKRLEEDYAEKVQVRTDKIENDR